MHLAILHYHLNRSGVTQVIANHLLALEATQPDGAAERVAVVYGGRREGWPEDLAARLPGLRPAWCVVPALDYDAVSAARPGRLKAELRAALREQGFGPHQTILHVHNHSLGKNVFLPGALADLARDGYRLLLQIHDFAEDLRPMDYGRLAAATANGAQEGLPALLYPQAPHVHYAVLNRRDYGILQGAGVAESRLHLLANPVAEPPPLPDRAEAKRRLAERHGVAADRRLLLSPVRCIRRKNVGESLLWSALVGPEASLAFTLPPLNPLEQPRYEAWKELARELKLACAFELGGPAGVGLADSLAAADWILTSSVAEGFGMVFVEPWLSGRAVVGRDLPQITADYREAGLRLDGLRAAISIPVDWIGQDAFCEAMARAYRLTLTAFGQLPQPPGELESAVRALARDGQVDFASLPSRFQEQVIRTVAASADRARELLQINPWITQVLGRGSAEARAAIEHNAACVRQHFSLDGAGRRLWAAYAALAQSSCREGLAAPEHGGHILQAFLNLEQFRPLRVEP